MLVTIWVKPGSGSGQDSVGGSHDGALIVRVSARAVDGKATEAALKAVATAFGVRRRDVTVRSGVTSRRKTVFVDAADAAVLDRLLLTPPV